MPLDPRIAATAGLQAVVADDSFYGVLVSKQFFSLLELRSAVLADQEVPLMNRLPVAVDKNLAQNKWEKVTTQEEWLARATAK